MHDKIVSAFLTLCETGYELLKVASAWGRELVAMDCVACGFTVAYLKAYLGHARCYIRPVLKKRTLFWMNLQLERFSGAKRTQNQLWIEGLTSMANSSHRVAVETFQEDVSRQYNMLPCNVITLLCSFSLAN